LASERTKSPQSCAWKQHDNKMNTSTKLSKQEIKQKLTTKNQRRKKHTQKRNYIIKNDSETNENIIHLNVYKNCGKNMLELYKIKKKKETTTKYKRIIHTYATDKLTRELLLLLLFCLLLFFLK